MVLLDHPVGLIVLLFGLSLLPVLVVLGSSFLKLAIVFSLLRNAIGIQQIPPNIALYSLALILTAYIMAPVGFQIQEALVRHPVDLSTPQSIMKIDDSVLAPYRDFLQRHTAREQIDFFLSIGRQSWPENYRSKLDGNSLLVLMPAFAIAQITEAFKIGVLIFLPFLAIDLMVSIILLAVGMMMVSPLTISLPFKILLFVAIGGWDKLLTQLMLSYS